MAKVTSKLQLTIPKALADAHAIRAGSEVQFESATDCIRLTVGKPRVGLPTDEKLRLLRESWEQQKARNARLKNLTPSHERGWTREEIYDRGKPR